VGSWVETPTPCFDPAVVTLMDFDVPQHGGIHFFYVLPQSDRHALVEATFLSERPFAEATYLEAIERYLAERHGALRFRELDRERGVIPMCATRTPARASRRVYRIGTAGGLVRPSTGYAFLAIQRWTAALAEGLLREELPAAPEPRPRITRILDSIFLSYLRRHPERGAGAFAALFARTPPDALVRFLTDRATPADRLAVMGALPARELAAEAWRSRKAWWRA
jgi:lycopene beta-cyclase